MISSLKLRNCSIYWNIVGVIDPFYERLFGIWDAACWVYTSMDFYPSLN